MTRSMTKTPKTLLWLGATAALVLILLGGRRAAEFLPRFAEWVDGLGTVLVAATTGACAAFLIARYAARDRVAARMQRDPRFAALDRAIGRAGRKIVILLRLSPVFPFSFLNYALGLTSVRFIDYVIACVAMLPGTLLYVYYGRVIGDVAALAAGARAERGWTYYLLLGIGLIATILVTATIARIARRELARNAPDAL
jgi:uncharacterized membrane protein YdjX (TVP38/TMEM64 family)